MHSTQHGFAFNVLATITTENPQTFNREAFIFYFILFYYFYYFYYFFSVKQNVKDIFIDSHRRKGQQKESEILKSIEKVKLSQNFWGHHRKWTWPSWLWLCENWDQQQPHDINPLTCELHQTMFDVLDFNSALKKINITLAYKNDENNIIVCTPPPPPPPVSPGGVKPPTKCLKWGRGLDRTSILRGGLLGRRGWIFQGGRSFYIKNKLKSEIFNNKTFTNKNVFL